MPAFLWQNLREEIEDEFARLMQDPLRKALEFFDVDRGEPQLLPAFAIVGSVEGREFWFDRAEFADGGKVSAEWLRQHVPMRVRKDRAKEMKRRAALGLCLGTMACKEPPVRGARLCHEHLAAARLADLKHRRQSGVKPKTVATKIAKPLVAVRERKTNAEALQALRTKRKQEGRCTLCKEGTAPGRRLCDRHLEANRELRARRKQEGRCAQCEESAAPGRHLCARHLEIKRQWQIKNRKRGMRAKLNDLREGLTHHFTVYAAVPSKDPNGPDEIEEIGGYIQTGLYPDGRVGEVFLKIGKPGDRFAMLDQWAMAFSFALQYGAPLEELCLKFMATRFEPSGGTKNPTIPRCTSLVDYAARWLLVKYVNPKYGNPDTPPEEEAPATEGEEWAEYQRLKEKFKQLEPEKEATNGKG